MVRPVAARPRPIVWLLVAPVVLVAIGVAGWLTDLELGKDMAVYRSAAIALVHGDPLYDAMSLPAEPSWARLPFTYPPVAALLFVPFAILPQAVAWGLMGAATVVCLTLVVRVCADAVPERPSWLTPGRTMVLLPLLLLMIEPVWRTLVLGQINVVLMALVVLDVLVLKGSRWSGVPIGLAAAVKLTPLIFVPYLLLTGRRVDALRAGITFAGLQAVMFAVAPHDSARFWTQALTDPARIQPAEWSTNQSLNGLMLRLTDLAPWSLPVALGAGALLAVPAGLLVRRLHVLGAELPALLATAFFGLLVAPVSWSHHWVWAAPLIVWLLARLPDPLPHGVARVRALAGVGAVIVVFLSYVLVLMRNGRGVELTWTPLEFVIGSAYLLVAGAFLVARPGRSG